MKDTDTRHCGHCKKETLSGPELLDTCDECGLLRTTTNRDEYKNPVCRGCWTLGNNCGTCERCIESKETKPGKSPTPPTAKNIEKVNRLDWIEIAREIFINKVCGKQLSRREAEEESKDAIHFAVSFVNAVDDVVGE